MSESEATLTSKKTSTSISTWKVGVAIMMAAIVVFIGFIFLRLVLPAKWGFTIEASTEIAEIELPPTIEVRWQVDGAIICARRELLLPDSYRMDAGDGPCGSRAWAAWKIPDPEQVIRLNGGNSVTMQSRPEGGFAMSLRAADTESLGDLSVVGIVNNVDIGPAINLIWTKIPPQPLIFPLSGSMTIGRAVSWSGTRVLEGGTVVVYTADESADKRKRVDETDLMLGDQVRLGDPDAGRPWPKGFVHVSDGENAMRIVAFGQSNSLRIERFGESGYDFKPGVIRKLAADPAVAFWGSVLAAYITLILSVQPFVAGNDKDDGKAREAAPALRVLKRFNRWLRS